MLGDADGVRLHHRTLGGMWDRDQSDEMLNWALTLSDSQDRDRSMLLLLLRRFNLCNRRWTSSSM